MALLSLTDDHGHRCGRAGAGKRESITKWLSWLAEQAPNRAPAAPRPTTTTGQIRHPGHWVRSIASGNSDRTPRAGWQESFVCLFPLFVYFPYEPPATSTPRLRSTPTSRSQIPIATWHMGIWHWHMAHGDLAHGGLGTWGNKKPGNAHHNGIGEISCSMCLVVASERKFCRSALINFLRVTAFHLPSAKAPQNPQVET
jgi:hypothetical protein